jgi:hypothetical protein
MAANTAVITLEGVLQKNVSYAPISVGLSLYHSLTSVFNVVLVSDGEQKEVSQWLDLEGLNKHGTVVYSDFLLDQKTAQQRRLAQIHSLRARGFAVTVVVEPDPIIASYLLANGYSVLNFLHSEYALPQWRPDYERQQKPWSQIVEEVNTQAELRAIDHRMAKQDQKVNE